MKKITLLLLLCVAQFGFSQDDKIEHEKMIEAEMKSASKTINFRANPNTSNYDITYHKLEFSVNPSVANIAGKVTTTYTALSNMNSITFDLDDAMVVSSVIINGNSETFSQNANELIITLPITQLSGTSQTVEISYSGNPTTTGFGSFTINTHGTGAANRPVLWTLSEPYGAKDWWPCKQDLNDKVNNIDVYITAPAVYQAVSNGLEMSAIVTGSNKTTHFKHNYPIPAYLIAIAVTNYQIYNQQGGLGTTASPFFPIVNYMYPETATANQTSLAVTPTIINFFESIIGPYPFRNEKYGHAQFGWGGGMEHTTVSFMTAGSTGAYSRGLISHEMAHQWFGNKVTCGSWKDIWLNEGITEYMSGLFEENFAGTSAFTTWKSNKISSITSFTTGNVYLRDSQLTDINRIFSSRLTYNKGSMITNMLRFKMGDANFFQGLRNYLSDPAYAYAYALTPQFQAKMEAVYGAPGSLQEFFNDWVYNEGYPTYTVNAFNSGAGQATIQINQMQSITNPVQIGYVSYFEMPITVRLTGSAGQEADFTLDNTTNGQTFNVAVSFPVTGIVVDPFKNIITGTNTATLGVNGFDYGNAIQMYPNPTSDILNIDLPTNITLEKIIVYNNLGQKSIETSLNKIDVSNLSSGIYIVSFETSEGKFHKNFIKK
jgi:aminopeptidase N